MKSLQPFTSGTSADRFKLDAEIVWTGSLMEVRFILSGPVGDLRGLGSHRSAPASKPVEGLWESTCFEAFFGPEAESFYYEINATADGRWMVFRFDRERIGRAVHAELVPQTLVAEARPSRFDLSVRFDFSEVDDLTGLVLRATPSAVLETAAGERSYWSLLHSKAQPDFHAPAHRVLQLKPA